MDNHPLIAYIKEAKARNMPTDEIVKALGEAGWKVHEIMEVVLEHGRIKELPIEEPKEPGKPEEPQKESIISIKNLSKSYKKVKALRGINLEIEKGSVTAFLGPNGAGKTTLVRILTTLLAPESGEITIAGLDPVKNADELRRIIGLTGQYAAIDETLTGIENLEMIGRLYHIPKKQALIRAKELLKQFDLEEASDRQVATYSGGMKRRLDLALSLITNPKILFLDEPTTGLDPRSRFDLWHIINDLVEDGTTVILTTQYLEEADQLADKIFVIDQGTIIAEGTPDELKKKVGGDVIDLHMENANTALPASKLIQKFGIGNPSVDESAGKVTLPIEGGASVLVDMVRELDKAGLKIRDAMLRRPSLDDVFMKLTGRKTDLQ